MFEAVFDALDDVLHGFDVVTFHVYDTDGDVFGFGELGDHL